MKRAILIIIAIFLLIQFIQIDKTNEKTPKNLEIKPPLKISKILKNACYDCHSNNTIWPWYSNIAPISWAIKSHVDDGKAALNFSLWENYTDKEKKKKLKKIFRTVYASMPLVSYIKFHDEANLTREQRSEIRDWTGVKK